VAYDHVTDGFKKLYRPNVGEPWDQEGAENQQKLDDLEIMLIATDGGGLALDLTGFGAANLFVVTNREIVGGPPGDEAQFSLGMAPLFTPGTVNIPHAPVGVRAPGFLHIATAPEFSVPAATFVGWDAPMPPGMPPGMAQFIVWEKDSQGTYYKAAQAWYSVMFAGGPP